MTEINKYTILTREHIDPVVAKWKETLGLQGWDFKIALVDKYSMAQRISEYESGYHSPADPEDVVLGCVTHCYPVEQVATVQFRLDAPQFFGPWVNLDTLVCHELIHVLVRDQFDRLPKSAQKSKKTGELEEYICDRFSYILYKALEGRN
jgi:hypothetical protein